MSSYLTPRESDSEMVRKWLSSHGIENVKRSTAGDWLEVRTNVRKARAMLGDAEFGVYQVEGEDRMIVRATE